MATELVVNIACRELQCNNVNNTLDSNQCFLFHTRLLVLEHSALFFHEIVKNIRD